MKRTKQTDKHVKQIVVDCTAKVQKTMRANLKKAAKDRVNPARAGIAKTLLEQAEGIYKTVAPEAPARNTMEWPAASPDQYIETATQTDNSGIWQSTKAGLRKLAAHVSRSLKAKRLFRTARGQDMG
jgi:hypothetical protein